MDIKCVARHSVRHTILQNSIDRPETISIVSMSRVVMYYLSVSTQKWSLLYSPSLIPRPQPDIYGQYFIFKQYTSCMNRLYMLCIYFRPCNKSF